MSEITKGVIGMPLHLAMASDLSRAQFHARAQELLAENERLQSAARTLINLGYIDKGGELWKPPLGPKPDFDLINALHGKIDRLLAHCPDGECATCGEIICPHGGAMHFHHDGCPSCAEHDEAEQEPRP